MNHFRDGTRDVTHVDGVSHAFQIGGKSKIHRTNDLDLIGQLSLGTGFSLS